MHLHLKVGEGKHEASTRTQHSSRLTRPSGPSDFRRLCDLQRKFDALPVDEEVAVSYGQLAAAVAATGRQPRSRVIDLLIAATAHAHGARLYTRNPADLVGIEHSIDIVAV